MSYTAVVPARWASSRFPGKPLVDLGGVPMVVRTASRAHEARSVDRVIVATDDERIVEVCEAHDIETFLTRAGHTTGTDRVVEASERLRIERIVNVQGDEPLIEPGTIDRVVDGLEEDDGSEVANAGCPLEAVDTEDPNVVKVVGNENGRVLYISRSPVPFSWDEPAPRLRHLGLYAFRGGALKTFALHSQGPVELAERIEMFRFLERGYPITLVEVPVGPPAVDTPEDVDRIDRFADEHGGWPDV
ncbi:MAG: 3-deoxy-manno-octulosonate cytidylyltransferase [Gemmatimonadetes bacterium]|nr:3-deoxy-manno-octulosonate cytidylyltransferase [Gemmatimonadota bacterium]